MSNRTFTPETPLPRLVIGETKRIEEVKDRIGWERVDLQLKLDEVAPSQFTLEVRQLALISLRSMLRESDPAFLSLTDGETRSMNDALPRDFWAR